jgi:hypothetical protein
VGVEGVDQAGRPSPDRGRDLTHGAQPHRRHLPGWSRPPGRAGRATAVVYTGNSLALVFGTPLATALGQTLGWRLGAGVVGLAAAGTPHGCHTPSGPHPLGATPPRGHTPSG